MTCLGDRCVAADCGDRDNGEPCSVLDVDGVCYEGTCVPVGCGDGVLAGGELCDDGNHVPGDGCGPACNSLEVCGNGVLDIREQCDDGHREMSGDGCSVACNQEFESWTEGHPLAFAQRTGVATAYDSDRGVVVLFGGEVGSAGEPLATWEWNGAAWRPRRFEIEPPSRSGAAMVYDNTRQRIVLFGGAIATSSVTGLLGDTWTYDGTAWTPLAIDGPSPRHRHAMAYDAARDRIVLYGGTDDFGPRSDTWEFDGAAWIERQPSSTIPDAGNYHAAYDPIAAATIVVGDGEWTWSWSGTDWAKVGWFASYYANDAFYFDPDRGFIDLVTVDGRTLEFKGSYWIELRQAIEPQSPSNIVIPDLGRHTLTLQTPGFTSVTDPSRTDWDRSFAISTSAAFSAGGAFDSHRKLYVFADGTFVDQQYVSRIWESDGDNVWATPHVVPATGGTMAYDTSRRTIVWLVADTTGQPVTWLFHDGAWTRATPAHSPPSRTGRATTYDASLQRVIVFGGRSGPFDAPVFSNDTWAWDGVDWALAATSGSPPAVANASLAYDPSTQRIVLFGGDRGTESDETWSLQAGQWSRLAVARIPTARQAGHLVYDPTRQSLVLIGGLVVSDGNIRYISDTWELRGGDWQPRLSLGTRYVSDFAFAAYDTRDHEIDLFGGTFRFVQLGFTSRDPIERCSTDDDVDGDGLRGCSDPDCFCGAP